MPPHGKNLCVGYPTATVGSHIRSGSDSSIFTFPIESAEPPRPRVRFPRLWPWPRVHRAKGDLPDIVGQLGLEGFDEIVVAVLFGRLDPFPLIVDALAKLRSRSCIIDGEAQHFQYSRRFGACSAALSQRRTRCGLG